MQLKAIKLRQPAIDVKKIEQAITNALNGAAKGAQVDFRVTTRTWTTKPDFEITTPSPDRRVVKTDSEIYKFVDKGTKPHIIRPRKAGGRLSWVGAMYRAKTQPGIIGSRASSNDNTIVNAKVVQHPGNEARRFSIVIRDKWAKELPIRMKAALVAATRRK